MKQKLLFVIFTIAALSSAGGCSDDESTTMSSIDSGMDSGRDAALDAGAFIEAGDSHYYPPVRDSGLPPKYDAGPAPAECSTDYSVIDRLNYACSKDDRPCASYQVRARLILDTDSDNFYTGSDGQPLRTGFIALDDNCSLWGWRSIELYYNEGEEPDSSIIPGAKNQYGWKVNINKAVIEYCKTCGTNFGPLPIVQFKGSLADIEFVHDLYNRLPLFIEVKDTEGNLVADIH